jgi:hypothetical protein
LTPALFGTRREANATVRTITDKVNGNDRDGKKTDGAHEHRRIP